MEMSIQQIGEGLRTRVLSTGGNKEVVIMLHGITNTLDVWVPSAMAFGNQFNIIAFDQRAHGQAEVLDGDYTIDAFARDLHNLIKMLGENPYAIVGHSFGCAVIQRYLQTYAGIPFKVILLQSSPKSPEFLYEHNFDLDELAKAKMASYNREYNATISNPLNWFRPEVINMAMNRAVWFGKGVGPIPPNRAEEMKILRRNLHFDYREKNSRVIQPNLTVIGGTEDEIIKEHEVISLRDSFQGAVLHWMNTGHMSMIDPAYFDMMRQVI